MAKEKEVKKEEVKKESNAIGAKDVEYATNGLNIQINHKPEVEVKK